MKYKLPFDDYINEQLGESEPVVPSYIWDNIREERNKKRPVVFWIWFKKYGFVLLSALLLMLTGGYFYFNKNESKSIPNKDVSAKTDLNQKNNFASTKLTSEKNNEIKNKSGFNQTQKNNMEVNADNTSIINLESSNAEHSTTLDLGDLKNNNRLHRKLNRTQKNSEVTNDKETGFNNNHKKYKTTKANKSSRIVNGDMGDLSQELINNSDSEKSLTPVVEKLSLLTSKKEFTQKIKAIKEIKLSIPCPGSKINEAANKQYIDFYASPDYVFRQFSDTPNSTYLKMRKESTTFSSAYSFGIRYTKVFGNGLNIRAGLNYSQINEKFKFVQGNIVNVLYIINVTGDTIGSYQTISTRYKTTYNKYRTLDVPITIGYEMSKGKWCINFNTGIIINAYSWNKGEVLNKSLQPVNINAGDSITPYQFKTNIGIGGLGAVSFDYTINKKYKLFAEPYFRYNFSTMSKSELTLKQKYHTTGIKFGLRIDF